MIGFRAFGCLVLCLLPALAVGQAVRLELGQRLRSFERAYEEAPADVRSRAVPRLNKATQNFFTFRLAEAARELDEARLVLGPHGASPAQRWAESLQLTLKGRFLDSAAGELRVEVKPLYGAGDRPEKVDMELLLTRDGKTLWTAKDIETDKETAWPIGPLKLANGDYTLELRVKRSEGRLASWKHTLSIVQRRDERLDALAKQAEKKKETTESETLRESVYLLRALAKGETFETHYPAARILRQAEELAEALRRETPYLPRPGEFWLALAGKGRTIVRLLAPPSMAKDRPVPLVIALHGAGGSENLSSTATAMASLPGCAPNAAGCWSRRVRPPWPSPATSMTCLPR